MCFDKDAKTIKWERIVLSTIFPGTTGYPQASKQTVGLLFTSYKRLTQNKDINVWAKTIKLLQEKICATLCDFDLGNVFRYDTKNTRDKIR